MARKVFPSAVSPGLSLFVFGLLGAVALLMLVERIWPALGILGLVLVFLLHLYRNTYYVVEGPMLTIRCGFLYTLHLPIATIREVRATRNPISSPALALERIELRYNRRDAVLVSPKDRVGFLNALRAVNPAIEGMEEA